MVTVAHGARFVMRISVTIQLALILTSYMAETCQPLKWTISSHDARVVLMIRTIFKRCVRDVIVGRQRLKTTGGEGGGNLSHLTVGEQARSLTNACAKLVIGKLAIGNMA